MRERARESAMAARDLARREVAVAASLEPGELPPERGRADDEGAALETVAEPLEDRRPRLARGLPLIRPVRGERIRSPPDVVAHRVQDIEEARGARGPVARVHQAPDLGEDARPETADLQDEGLVLRAIRAREMETHPGERREPEVHLGVELGDLLQAVLFDL